MSSNSVRVWQRKNAQQIARHFSRSGMLFPANGMPLRVTDKTACEVLERALAQHMRSSSKPTAMRLTLDEARAFPGFDEGPDDYPAAWLVIVSDRAGGFAYAIRQEGRPEVDPQIRAAGAKACAQYDACIGYLRQQQLMGKLPMGRA